MSRTLRYCNKSNFKMSPYYHRYKLMRSHCRCDYCIDDHASKHRREKIKIEIKREFLNFKTIFDLYGDEGFYSNCFRNCESWRWCCLQDGSCSQIGEIKIMSCKRAYSIK